MSKMRLIGDVHGKFNSLDMMMKTRDTSIPSVQVGDMGVGFPPDAEFYHSKISENLIKHNITFIRGNHDNPQRCEKMAQWIPDGIVQNDIMYVGGAWSIDHRYRQAGHNWWPDEEVTMQKAVEILDVYQLVKPKIMVTHDAPLFVTNEMFIKTGKSLGGGQIRTLTGQLFDEMMKIHQPKFWAFGHWHVSQSMFLENTEFVCLGELDSIVLDTDELAWEWEQSEPVWEVM